MNAIEVWAAEWHQAKAEEVAAIAQRRFVEDQIIAAMEVDQTKEGTTTIWPDGYEIKIVTRIDKKVDADMLQEIAAEHGLSDHLSSLFRWKPEVNAKNWNKADASITGPLAPAITAKPGRPSFTITRKD